MPCKHTQTRRFIVCFGTATSITLQRFTSCRHQQLSHMQSCALALPYCSKTLREACPRRRPCVKEFTRESRQHEHIQLSVRRLCWRVLGVWQAHDANTVPASSPTAKPAYVLTSQCCSSRREASPGILLVQGGLWGVCGLDKNSKPCEVLGCGKLCHTCQVPSNQATCCAESQ